MRSLLVGLVSIGAILFPATSIEVVGQSDTGGIVLGDINSQDEDDQVESSGNGGVAISSGDENIIAESDLGGSSHVPQMPVIVISIPEDTYSESEGDGPELMPPLDDASIRSNLGGGPMSDSAQSPRAAAAPFTTVSEFDDGFDTSRVDQSLEFRRGS